ncbi:MAG: Ig-like domain-containing protein [Pseudomonadota bacterium]
MRDILDAADTWMGSPPGGFSLIGNKAPVAIADTLTLVKDSAATTVAVLANDFDPEGQPLTLVAATAALGTAVAEADNTVTYTPLPGFAGFDTVTYEIADDQDLRRQGQINVTIIEPQLSIDVSLENTLVVTAQTGELEITVSDPPALSGTWTIDTGDLIGGPINLVPPAITGLVAEGELLTAETGLWVYDTGSGLPVQSWQWRRGATEIAGATGTTYTVTAADIGGAGLTVGQTLSDGFGQRQAVSAAVGAGFQPSDDASLIGWWDADDAATITETGGAVSSWADKAGGDPLVQTAGARQPVTGARVLNGRNVLDFDGDDLLEMAMTLPTDGNVAFHLVLGIDAVQSAFAAVFGVDGEQDFQIDANNDTQFDGRLNPNLIGGSTLLTGGPFSGAFILSAVFDQTGSGTAEIHISNALRATMVYSAPISSAVTFLLMTNRSKNAWIDGSVGEVIVTGDVGNRADHHAYLATKWGLS